VQVRDDLGTVALGTIGLDAIELLLDREVLWVDDSLDDVNPTDEQHDAFWMNLFTNSGRFEEGDVYRLDVFGAGDLGSSNPSAPGLSEMGRYKLLVWECRGVGFNGRTALLENAGLSRLLGLYLAAGGQLWLGGRTTVAATTSSNGVSADFNYPKDMSDLPDNFAVNFLKLGSTRIDNDKGADVRNFIAAAMVPPGRPAIYDPMSIDLDKLNPLVRVYGGVSHADAVFNPIDAGLISNYTGVLDTLYLYGSAGVLAQGRNSLYHNRLCAFRWHDPDPDPVHGRTQWFGFSLYFMDDMEAQNTFNRSIDWFRGDGPVPVTLSLFTAGWKDDAAVIRWEVTEATDHAGFFVHRETPDGKRVRLHRRMLSDRTSYEFVDADAPAGGARYWLEELSRSGATSWHGPLSLAPRSVAPRVLTLASAPNPFRASTDIAYILPERAPVLLTVYDVQGRRVATLVDAVEDAGEHTISWGGRGDDGTLAASGLYFLRLRAGGDTRVLKAILSR
jgi:hypothetical protein